MTATPTKIAVTEEMQADLLRMRLFRLLEGMTLEELRTLGQSYDIVEEVTNKADETELEGVVSFEPFDGPRKYEGDPEAGYDEMAADEAYNREADAWTEGLLNYREINEL